MPWPAPQDYNEAIQNPRLTFDDPMLRAGVPELTSLGLPRPITGNFASVYRMRCGAQDLAVRCFWREFADLQARYAAISDHLKAAGLPYTVGFEYLPRGINVRGQWYPILKMEWVEGELLTEYVERHLHDRGRILELAVRWHSMVEALARASIAHGDLQHGNVLVVNGDLKLVDYDGMFVPALQGRTSHEMGHPNYQHPGRTGLHFGLSVDHFSALVVYLSLLALCDRPELWTMLNGGDECLLFRKTDFDPTGTSTLLQQLEQASDLRVSGLAQHLRSCLVSDPLQIPALGAIVQEDEPESGAGEWRVAHWLRGRRLGAAHRAGLSAGGQVPPSPGGPPAWVREAITSPSSEIAWFVSPMTLPRRCTLLSSLLLAASTIPVALNVEPVVLEATLIGPLLALVNLVVLIACFRADAMVTRRRVLVRREREHSRGLKTIQREVQHRERERARLTAARDNYRQQARQEKERILARERQAREAVRASIREVMQWLADDVAALDRQERSALEAALRTLQDDHVTACLRGASLRSASIPGVGIPVKIRLWLLGVRSAADVSSDTIGRLKRALGDRIVSVVTWRASIQVQAHRTKPRRLSPAAHDRLTGRYRVRRERLSRRQDRLMDREKVMVAAIVDLHASKLGRIERELAEAAAAWEACCRELDRAIAEVRKDEPYHHRQLAQLRTELQAYDDLTFGRYTMEMLLGICPLPLPLSRARERGDDTDTEIYRRMP